VLTLVLEGCGRFSLAESAVAEAERPSTSDVHDWRVVEAALSSAKIDTGCCRAQRFRRGRVA